MKSMDSTKFDVFWSLYPRRDARVVAKQKWDKAVKKTPADTIISALQSQIDAGRFTCDREFMPMAKTWLSQERWNDEIVSQRVASAADGLAERYRDACLRGDDRAKAEIKSEAKRRNVDWNLVRDSLMRVNSENRNA